MEKDASQIRREIEETRERLGDTVEALAFKADVSARAKDAVNEHVDLAKDAVHDRVDSAKRAVAGVVDAATTALGHVAHSAHEKVTDVVDTVRPQHTSELRDTIGS